MKQQLRFQWAFHLMDVPLATVEVMVRNILTRGAGADARMVSAGAMDVPATAHTLRLWLLEHGEHKKGGAATEAIEGFIRWMELGALDPLAPDMYSMAATLLLLCHGDFTVKADLIFALFGFNSGGPKGEKRPVEPVITPDELCFLICSVCAGLSGIGLGSAFRAPSGSALTLIAADAVLLAKEVEEEEAAAQARARGSDRISIDHSHYNGGEGVAA